MELYFGDEGDEDIGQSHPEVVGMISATQKLSQASYRLVVPTLIPKSR